MNVKAIANEFAKMRHLKVGPIVVLLLVSVVGLVMFYSLSSGLMTHLDDPGERPWKTVFAALRTGASLISPVLLAVLASRQVEIEHSGNGWLASSTSGLTPGQLCRAKFAALGLPITLATVAWGALLIGFGTTIGITTPVPIERWAGYITSLAVINLAVLAFQILLSAKIENQLVCLGIGVVGIFIAYFGAAMPAWASHLTPWGYYTLTTPADFVGTELVYFDLPYLSVLALAVVGSGLFLFITGRFDRQEA
ncbi:ABC transporter permease [Nocardiopsis sp. HUAS JQ3]|uniref:ABC transporter permease n=1 Tax=Nocardiopsis sp. HUAS JQ3 TaxID=3061629 RepID=UPI0023AA074E|nr:ABC transporter permease [Nocardiopsis sp. HUAS JQ3]WDZ90605.1 ABC transporter permease [Nocardiopsis sp. HUAS JQ3]